MPIGMEITTPPSKAMLIILLLVLVAVLCTTTDASSSSIMSKISAQSTDRYEQLCTPPPPPYRTSRNEDKDQDGSSSATVTIASGDYVMLRNGFVCAVFDLQRPSLAHLSADFEGNGEYGANALMSTGVSLVRVAADGQEYSSADTGSACVSGGGGGVVPIVEGNATSVVQVRLVGITDACPGTSDVTINETWVLSLAACARSIRLSFGGFITQSINPNTIRSIAHRVWMRGSSITSLFDRGVVQMRANADPQQIRYASGDVASRVFSLGGCCDVLNSAGNVSLSIVRDASQYYSSFFNATSPRGFVGLYSAVPALQPFWSGFEEYVVLNTTTVPLDSWSVSSSSETIQMMFPQGGLSWSSTMKLAPNQFDFPILPGTLLPDDACSPNLPTKELHAMLTGIYASPVGNLFTHDNEVATGYRVGQIATTIHRPDVGYSDMYNFFDPDNYFSTYALLSSGDSYLHHEVRRVLERSGDFLNEAGQLPHHFVGIVPVYQAISGAIQTGPNVFWILSCFNYAKYSGDIDWLIAYMPRIRNASMFLFDMIDEKMDLLRAPGSLYIDVFIRNNFTSDSNGMLVGFFDEFAQAEELVGNAPRASTLRQLSASIAAAMNAKLLASTNDHFITQLNPDGTIRDFVDYDSNLISLAHGVPSTLTLAKAVMSRVDGGRCTHGRATFVSERYYGPSDCVGGNIGDSWCSMGRNGWFDALTRKRYNDLSTFNALILDPLIDDVRRWTWLWERYSCDGTPQLNRTWAYFEYPSVTAAMISYVRYGIHPGYDTFTVDPFLMMDAESGSFNGFSYQVGFINISVSTGGSTLNVALPPVLWTGRNITVPTRKLTVTQLIPSSVYTLTAVTGCDTSVAKVFVGTTSTVNAMGQLVVDVPVQDAEGNQCSALLEATSVPTTTTTAAPSSLSPGSGSAESASSSSSGGESHSKITAIAGSIIGAVAAVAVVGLILYWRRRAASSSLAGVQDGSSTSAVVVAANQEGPSDVTPLIE